MDRLTRAVEAALAELASGKALSLILSCQFTDQWGYPNRMERYRKNHKGGMITKMARRLGH